MPEIDSTIDWIAGRILDDLACSRPVGPVALRLLVRRYGSTPHEELRDALGPALGHAVSVPPSGAAGAEHLHLLVDATAISADEAIQAAVDHQVVTLTGAWPSRGRVADAMAVVHAVLASTSVVRRADLLARAVDELERIVGAVYEPGDGVSRTVSARRTEPGDLLDITASAAALECAHALTCRLPYGMLAEELMQHARRRWWEAEAGDGAFALSSIGSADTANVPTREIFTATAGAAAVVHRLVRLRRDDEYASSVASAETGDYAEWLDALLASLARTSANQDVNALAAFGLVLEEARRDEPAAKA